MGPTPVRNSHLRPLISSVLILLSGCTCRPELPDVPDPPTPPEEPPPVDTAVDDTAPEPPCEVPEIEPNGNFNDAMWIELEQRGCGAFESVSDLSDWWQFEFPDEGSWLNMQVDAQRLASWANVQVFISTDEIASSVIMAYGHDTTDVDLRYPAAPGTYTAMISEVNLQGDEDHYFYELMPSQSKPPFDWDWTEPGDNDDPESAFALASGESVFGDMNQPGDVDYYAIDVPAGRHTLTLDIDAIEFGSAGNFTAYIYDEEDIRVAIVPNGVQGWEHDPYSTYISLGDETLYVQVVENNGDDGTAFWYRLSLSLEES